MKVEITNLSKTGSESGIDLTRDAKEKAEVLGEFFTLV